MNEIEWQNGTLPVSTRFDDPYYSKHDGRAETGHVFINGNDLPNRWPAMQNCVIAELGFGTSLNFLETVRQWRLHKPSSGKLTYISFEQYPMPASDMEKALSNWPELSDLKERLLELWTPENSLVDAEFADNIYLEIHMSDANERLQELNFEADAWYLDGFSPAKNPELWNETLLQEVSNHTVVGGTFATYTAAGFVRRNLINSGFNVRKVKGFGFKRDMLCGNKMGDIHVADRH